MFLTLEQADKIVRGILSSSSSSSSSSSALEGQVGALDEGTNDDVDVVPIVNRWEDIGITDPNLLRNLRSPDALSCPCPLPVQDRACPAIVSMNDVLVSTHTGSGKTLAFLAPIAQGLLMEGGGGAFPRAMIVAPGRELASQIVSVARSLFAGTGLTVEMAIGGTPYSRNVERLRKTRPDVVVGVSFLENVFVLLCLFLSSPRRFRNLLNENLPIFPSLAHSLHAIAIVFLPTDPRQDRGTGHRQARRQGRQAENIRPPDHSVGRIRRPPAVRCARGTHRGDHAGIGSAARPIPPTRALLGDRVRRHTNVVFSPDLRGGAGGDEIFRSWFRRTQHRKLPQARIRARIRRRRRSAGNVRRPDADEGRGRGDVGSRESNYDSRHPPRALSTIGVGGCAQNTEHRTGTAASVDFRRQSSQGGYCD